ncbi:MarR family winged helix-turn-helix transcriptional regulator [Acidovorax radicis]|uniref:MarR family winged helix-turn-helix transcriptional regulator n=1 Tax=Acidovorax radicis TaxID=758826 RepID=UPI0002377C25|nr:MarR family transcriptional regulator [Acidovorax radicis]
MREVARLYTRAQRVVADCSQTSNTQCHLLTELGRSGPLSLSELGARVRLEKSWISRAVDTLVARGLVTKEPNPADARSWLVTLTAYGTRSVDELNAALDAHATRLMASLTERDRAAISKSLALLMQVLEQEQPAHCGARPLKLPNPPERSQP